MIYHIQDFIKSAPSVIVACNNASQALSDGDTLLLGGGRLDIYSDGAYQQYYCISNNDKGQKKIAFPLMQKKNITIDGEGAELLFHGAVIPFAIDGCENVTVKHLSIDYEHPEYCQARIIDADDAHVTLQFDNEFPCRVEGDKLVFQGSDGEMPCDEALCLEFDSRHRAPAAYAHTYFFYSGAPKDHGFLEKLFRDVTLHQLAQNRIELRGSLGFTHTVGNDWLCTFGGRDCPGFFINESKSILLEQIDLYHALSMGVIAQLSADITLRAVNAVIRDGSNRMLSVKADATHFVNCRGNIEITNSKFVNMMDDACNIHGIYLAGVNRVDAHTFAGRFGHFQQEGINFFRRGDRVSLIDAETQRVCATLTVEIGVLDGEQGLIVTVKEEIPALPADCVAENLTDAPNVHLAEVESGNNRPRGFLLSSSGKILVEKCKFHNMKGGVCAGMDMAGWYESGAIRDLTVRNCDFDNSAYAGSYPIYLVPAVKNKKQAGAVFGRICIENNRFRLADRRFMQVENAAEVIFRGNTFVMDPTLPSHPDNGALVLLDCQQIDTESV